MPLILKSQNRLTGVVLDETDKRALAFVSITVNKRGAVTDIDGRFSIPVSTDSVLLDISHVGYRSLRLMVVKKDFSDLRIYIQPQHAALDNVTIPAAENPALRIIRLLQQHKQQHDPKKMPQFQYNAYTVAAIGSGENFWSMNDANTGKKPSDKRKSQSSAAENAGNDTLLKRFKENYLFITESYTKRIFRSPGQSKETVLATKASGIKAPVFAVTSANFQPFGFYEDYLHLLDKKYVNPVTNGSIGLYRFKLLETRINENDTTFIISFQPKKKTNFNGLQGTLYINSDGYAIENVSARAADEKGLLMRFRIQQKYERISNRWFPAQLNSTITQTNLANDSALVYWDTRSYISNTNFAPQISGKDFSNVETEMDAAAPRRTEEEWSNFRTDSLYEKEKQTYQTYTMLPPGVTNALEGGNRLIEIMALQAIPAGKIDIPFRYFLNGINRYERIRIGCGFQTNELFSKTLSLGGFAGYGIKDRAWKYGGNLVLTIDKRTGTSLRFGYSRDLEEPGNVNYFVRNSNAFSNTTLRNFYTFQMDSVQQFRADFSTRVKPSFEINSWMLNEKRNPARYNWIFNNQAGKIYRSFTNTEAGIGFRYTHGERYSMIGRARVMSRPATTELMAQFSKGFSGISGDLNYTRLALQFAHRFENKRLGTTSVFLSAGQIWGNVPYSYLFNIRACDNGSFFSLYIPNLFQTAGLYEFTADKSAALFIQHNFGSLLLKPANPHIRPEFTLLQSVYFGSLENAADHQGIPVQAATKGLYESGLMVTNIYRANLGFLYMGLGTGVFVRYGAYSRPATIDNLAFKIGINFSF